VFFKLVFEYVKTNSLLRLLRRAAIIEEHFLHWNLLDQIPEVPIVANTRNLVGH
jgi:hypothetical protein